MYELIFVLEKKVWIAKNAIQKIFQGSFLRGVKNVASDQRIILRSSMLIAKLIRSKIPINFTISFSKKIYHFIGGA